MEAKTKPRSCHQSRHLGGCQYVVYDVLTRLLKSRGMSEITISTRHLSAMTIYSKDAIAAALRALEADGWIQRYIGQDAPGRYQADTYSVVPHTEWAEKHTGSCEALANRNKSI
jgi:SOS-response transcriptional repressor LexA